MIKKIKILSVVTILSISISQIWAGDNAWTRSGSHYSYTKIAKIATQAYGEGGVKYTFSVGCPAGSFDISDGASTGSPSGIDLTISVGSATGVIEYIFTSLPAGDVSISMSGKLIIPGGSGGSQPTWGASATGRSPFFLLPLETIVGAGTDVTITASGNPTNSTWTVNGSPWEASNGEAIEGSSLGLNSTLWTAMEWDPYPVPDDYNPPTAGTYSIAATTTEVSPDTPRSATATVKVIGINSISVSGASQTDVTGAKNWAVVKGTGNVTITATLTPTIAWADIPAGLITWTGGTAVTGQPLQRTVSKGTSAKTTVKITCGSSSKEVDIWVIWSSVSIQVSGTKPSATSSILTFAVSDPTCGETTTTINGHLHGYGNMMGTVTLTPAGVGAIAESGWDIKRNRMIKVKEDGVESTPWDTTWQNDDTVNTDEILIPINDHLYVIDYPGFGRRVSANTVEVNMNFEEWVKWNGTDCSDKEEWHYKGIWTSGSPETITNHDVNTGSN